jgi:metal-dependent amidase/aminoacylase/carboxypeptidase family protein
MADVMGADRVVRIDEPTMGSEDFAWFAERVPAAHVRLGSKIEGVDTSVHRADYRCDERVIGIGVRVITRVVLDLLDNVSDSAPSR